jgi:hypothetical protein
VFGRLPPALHRALVREYVSSASAGTPHPDALAALVAPWLGEWGQPAFYRQIGHLVQEDAPAELTGALLSFLRGG